MLFNEKLLLEGNKRRSGLNAVALVDMDSRNGRVMGCHNLIFHLHRFQNHQDVALLDRLANLYINGR